MTDNKSAKFLSNDGEFSFRVAPDSGELDENGKPKKDGKLTFTPHEPTTVSEITRKVRVNVRQPDGSYKEEEVERTIDAVARARQYVPTRLSEVKGDKPAAAAADDKSAKRGR